MKYIIYYKRKDGLENVVSAETLGEFIGYLKDFEANFDLKTLKVFTL